MATPAQPETVAPRTARRHVSLRDLLATKSCLRAIEAHSPICAIVAESARIDEHGDCLEYDALWSGSLTDATARGKPDTGVLDIRQRLSNIDEIFEVTSKPLLVDADSGGYAQHFELNVRALERRGVAAVIIEDKVGFKKNSLLGAAAGQVQESAAAFADKIRRGKAAQDGEDFMIIARIESLVLGAGMTDALQRALAYVDAGADGIMIHSNRSEPDELLDFARRFRACRASHAGVALVCVPTRLAEVSFAEFARHGFQLVVYANQLLRAAYPAMREVALAILRQGRTLEAEAQCMPVEDILRLVPGTC